MSSLTLEIDEGERADNVNGITLHHSPLPLSSSPSPTPTLKEHNSNKAPFLAHYSLPRELLLIGTLCFGQIITQASLAQSVVISNQIGQSFSTSEQAAILPWFAAAFSLTVGSFILIAGRVGDIYGHKKCLIASYTLYTIVSILAAISVYSNSVIWFMVFRALQGIGCSFAIVSSVAILGRSYKAGRWKHMSFAAFGACAPNGFLMGAATSAGLAMVWWPYAYYLAACGAAFMTIVSIIIIPPDHVTQQPTETDDGQQQLESKPKQQFDWLGAFTGLTGLILFNVAWNQAPAVKWDTGYIIALLIVGVLFMVLFAYVERQFEQPLLPPSALNAESASVLISTGCGWASMGIWLWYTFNILQNLRHESPILTAAQFVPAGISGGTAALTAGFLLKHVHATSILFVSMCAFCIGTILIATMPVDQTYWAQTFASLIIMVWGMFSLFLSLAVCLSPVIRVCICIPSNHLHIHVQPE
jgi:MFS family permease